MSDSTDLKSPDGKGGARQLSPRVAMAQARHHAGQREEAERLYREALAADPDDPAANHFLGVLLHEAGRTPEGDEFLDRSVALAPQDAIFHNNRGHFLVQRGELAAGEAACRRAISLEPKFARAHLNLAMALRAQGRIGEAIDEARLAVSHNPRLANAYVQLARLLHLDPKKAGEALGILDQALAIDPNYADAHFSRGHVLTSLGRHEEAIASFAKAAKLFRSEVTLYELGTALAVAGRNEEARAAFWTSITLKPDYVPAHYAFTQLTWTMGLKDQHLASYAYAREKVGDNPELLLSEASARIYMNDAAEAAACLEHASSVAPGRADIQAELGRAYTVLNRHDDAVAAYERAERLSNEAGVFHQGYGASLLRAGQKERAVSVLEDAHRKSPTDQLVLGTLTAALREAGDPRYKQLVDISKYVRTYDIAVPRGFADAQAFNRALVEELSRYHTRKTEPFDQTLRGGSQTTGHLFREDSRLVSILRGALSECVAQYIRDMPDDPAHPTASRKSGGFEFSGAWSCALRKGGHHINHVHSQGWVSSAYYVQLPQSVDDEAARQGWLTIGRSGFETGAGDMAEAYVRPIVGRLVLFPSFYWHGTVPFTDETERVTVAFDAVPT